MRSTIWKLLPGVALTAALACAARWLHGVPAISGISALMLAIFLGMAVGNTAGVPAAMQSGIRFSMRRLLRLAIVLLGFQISLRQILQVGGPGFLIVLATLVCTFLFTVWLGRRLGVDPKVAELIAAGTSICGASAIVAANTVTEADDEAVTYSIAIITALGTASILLYPLAAAAMGMPSPAYGLWTGASIHEIAQVVAAAFQGGSVSAQYGAISKLSRVMLLAPVVFTLGYLAARRRSSAEGARARVPVPWFLLGFLAMIAVNSLGVVPAAWTARLVTANQFLLAAALAAMGLETSLRKLRAAGMRPFLLGGGAWCFISILSLALIRAFYW
ncbi:MAG TPA: YeiH family protein [Candidatus Acidoferrales bacterium]|nr:YeiH family protein [Candidatus Acidoferrales bacterium]